jgi:hypothetical protein
MANFRINRDAREQPIVWHGAIVQVLTEDAKTISEGVDSTSSVRFL